MFTDAWQGIPQKFRVDDSQFADSWYVVEFMLYIYNNDNDNNNNNMMCIYIYIYDHTVYLYIYIYIGVLERAGAVPVRGRRLVARPIALYMYVYIYIYIYI